MNLKLIVRTAVFLDDINARLGRSSNVEEEKLTRKYGEENQKRNIGGSRDIANHPVSRQETP